MSDVDVKDLFSLFALNFLNLHLKVKHISCRPKDQKVLHGMRFLLEVGKVLQLTAISLTVLEGNGVVNNPPCNISVPHLRLPFPLL
jgi:hypothetical protein